MTRSVVEELCVSLEGALDELGRSHQLLREIVDQHGSPGLIAATARRGESMDEYLIAGQRLIHSARNYERAGR